jgi:tetratricopeptide (TPR) repeat protein
VRIDAKAICSVLLALISFSTERSLSHEVPGHKDLCTREALDRIEKTVQNEVVPDEVYEKLSQILEEDPKNYRAHILLGECYEQLGLPELAMEQFQLGSKYGPNDAKSSIEMMKALFKSGKVQAAMAMLNQVKERFPKDPEVFFWVGNYLYANNKIDDAESLYKAAFQSGKNIAGLPSALGNVMLLRGAYPLAVSLANRDLDADPKLNFAYEIKGRALAKMGRYREATAPLAKAFDAFPLKPEISSDYRTCLYWQGKYLDALPPALCFLASTSSLNSNNIEAKKELSQTIRSVSRSDIESAIQAVSRNPLVDGNAAFHFALGDVLDRSNYCDLAILQYQSGLKLQPTFGRAWYRVAIDLERSTEEYELALQCYRKAKRLARDIKGLDERMRRLETRLANRRQDLAWQFKDWLKDLVAHQ